MATNSQFPEWDELPEEIRQILLANGHNEESYAKMAGATLWVVPWGDLTEEIRVEFESHEVTEEIFEANRLEKESMQFCYTLDNRVICTEDLKTVFATSRFMEYNRMPEDGLEDLLDLQGTHVINPIMVHRFRMFEVVDPHMRAFLYMKTKGTEKPVQIIIDMSMEHFNNCQTTNDFAEERGISFTNENEGEWERFLRDFWETIEQGPQARFVEIS